MNIHVKRIYENESKSDGSRILVDRLWPRGISKERAHIADWLKDAAPSGRLRTWFHEDADKRWAEFKKRYQAELAQMSEDVKRRLVSHKGTVTLVTAAKDVERSHVPILKSFMEGLRG